MSTSAKYPVSASSAVCRMVVRNVSDQLVSNVGGHGSEMVRNVAEQVSTVGGFRVRDRNVSGSGSVMVSDVGQGKK